MCNVEVQLELQKIAASRATAMEGGHHHMSVDDVFRDFRGRRAAIIKALTADVEEFYRQCDPDKENLCLYGYADEKWAVSLPADEVPPELPEPALGINFARDGMQEKEWLALVAVHSDAWLLAVSYYFGARYGFDRNDRKESGCRKRLFNTINELPTIFEVVSGAVKKQAKEKPTATNYGSLKSKSTMKMQTPEVQMNMSRSAATKDEDDTLDEEEHGDTLCGACGENYSQNEFWIGCDGCEKWYHGKCVKITPARAQHIPEYKCPSCTNKRARA